METRNKRSTKTGLVIKSADDKTVTVLVSTLKQHDKYKKVFKSSKKYLTHVDTVPAKVGDKVTIQSCRPLSKRKHWRVISVEEIKS